MFPAHMEGFAVRLPFKILQLCDDIYLPLLTCTPSKAKLPFLEIIRNFIMNVVTTLLSSALLGLR